MRWTDEGQNDLYAFFSLFRQIIYHSWTWCEKRVVWEFSDDIGKRDGALHKEVQNTRVDLICSTDQHES